MGLKPGNLHGNDCQAPWNVYLHCNPWELQPIKKVVFSLAKWLALYAFITGFFFEFYYPVHNQLK
jgi:hypothetical protein